MRLTERINGVVCSYWCGENCKYNHKYCSYNSENCPAMTDMYEKLAGYEYMEEQGRLMVLPCVAGDEVYEVQRTRKRVQAYVVTAVEIAGGNPINLSFRWHLKDNKGIYGNSYGFTAHDIGKTVFLNEDEAKKALKESGSEN